MHDFTYYLYINTHAILSETLSSSFRTSKWGRGITGDRQITSSQATLSDIENEFS